MQENRPEHQHYIPRSYLKHFAFHQWGKKKGKKPKRFVDVVDVRTRDKKYLSVGDVCVKSGLYTLSIKDGDPYKLEKYYAEHVDALFPEVYDMLVDKKVNHLSKRDKAKVLNIFLSLYFRTPKFLNAQNQITDTLIDRALELTDPGEEQVRIAFEGRDITFDRAESDTIKRKLREEGRIAFLATQFQKWHEFVLFKDKCPISVFEIEGEIDLITCDNPVFIHSSQQNRFHLFDPTNVIQVPLDRRHFLFIYPNFQESDSRTITRAKRNKFFALGSNRQAELSAERWVIGFPGSVEKHFTDHDNYGDVNNEESVREYNKMREKVPLLQDLANLIKMHGSLNPLVVERVRQLRRLDCMDGDETLEGIIHHLARNGHLTF